MGSLGDLDPAMATSEAPPLKFLKVFAARPHFSIEGSGGGKMGPAEKDFYKVVANYAWKTRLGKGDLSRAYAGPPAGLFAQQFEELLTRTGPRGWVPAGTIENFSAP
jgi:hypothetical protein